MPPVVSHVLLALAIAAGAGASVRVASTAVPRGLGRAVAAAVVWGALVVAQTLALGLAGLGGSAIALTVAAGLAWLASRAALPEPATTLGEDLAAAWAGLDRRGRALAAALGGVAAMWTVWLLFYPALGVDGTMYHLPEALSWVRNGRPGSSSALLYDLPVESYPLTDEVLRAWGTAIGESFVWSTFVTPAGAILALAAGWLGLRAVRIDRAAAALALVALAATPVFVIQLNTTSTDMTAVAWLVCCAALSAVAVRERSLWTLAIAIVAAGLAIGTKTTTAPLALIALGAAGWALRGAGAGGAGEREEGVADAGGPGARPHRWAGAGRAAPILAGALVAVAVGGVWYLRNLLEHGSPLWPFIAAPWGTPSPPVLEALRPSLLDRPRATLEGNLDVYATLLGGAVVLLLAAPLGALLARRRTVLAASLAALAGLLSWANAPVTGRGDIPGLLLTGSATRYLLPAIAAAAFALAIAAREGGRAGRILALALLAGSAAWSVVEDARLQFPNLPAFGTLVSGALLGLFVLGGARLWSARRRPRPRARRRRLPAPARVLVGAGLAGLLGAFFAAGFVLRHATITAAFDSELVSWFRSQPGFETGTGAIAFAPHQVAALAGDRLTHPLELIAADEPCDRVRARLRDGYVVIRTGPTFPVTTRPGLRFPTYGTAAGCLRALRPAYANKGFRVYAPGRAWATKRTMPCSSSSRTCREASSRSTWPSTSDKVR